MYYLKLTNSGLCLTHQPQAICIVETWLDNTISDDELCIDNYAIVRHDRNRHGGGLIYVINYLSYNIVFPGSQDLELIVLSINSAPSKVTLGLFYRPPNSPSPVLDDLLTVSYSHVDISVFSNFILLEDFNVNFLDPQHPLFRKLQLLASSLCSSQVVTEPTHISSTSCTLIDLVFLSTPANNTCIV